MAVAPLPPAAMRVPPMPMTAAMAMPPAPSDAQSLRARYGAPDFIRREMETELWRYDGKACSIFFFLYRDGDVLKLRYSETTPRGMNMAADPACVESLNARGGMF
jgi:hypothetical protein